MMPTDLQKFDPISPNRPFRPALPPLGLTGALLLPLALAAYLIALPFFGLFWLIDWLLPLPTSDAQFADEPQTLAACPEDSPSH